MEHASVELTNQDPVIQFSIFTENKVGRLSNIARIFSQAEIHIIALTTLDTTDSAILRVILDDPDAARRLLVECNVAFSESQVLAVEIAGERDVELVLMALLETEININYIYSFLRRPMGRSALAMSIEDMDIAVDILGARNLKVLSQRDISR